MKADSKVDSIVRGILDYLQVKKSLDLLPQVLEELGRQGLNRVDPNLALVKSPVKLEPSQISAIRQILSKNFKRPIQVKTRIDKSIIAGFIIEIDGKLIDASLDKELETVKEQMLYD
ncbi:MAG TPA: F0F1 ATP synthase subunit delta [Patescibacteria group bacterium]|nr:F0F1 ATP synthase subunit delta [Patescibacteria group bacterium]